MKINLSVTVPDELAAEFMQVIRDFDTKHDPRHEDKIVVQMLAETDKSIEQMQAIHDAIRPPFEMKKTIRFDS